jgi:F-type H+-transporting ATPase subunit O
MDTLESREDVDYRTLTHRARTQYTAAAKTSSLDAVSKAMENFQATFKKDKQLQKILSAPTLSIEDKQQIVAELQKSTGVTDKTVKQFLETLAANNRLSILEGVSEKFGTLMSAARGEVEMTITSASPLDAKVVRQLENAVSKSQFIGQGKKLKGVTKVCLHGDINSEILHRRQFCANDARAGQP